MPPGHIDTGLFNGGVFLAQHDAGVIVHHKVLVHLLAVEGLDVGGGLCRVAQNPRRRKGFVNFRLVTCRLSSWAPSNFRA